jgi:hypothetical protein
MDLPEMAENLVRKSYVQGVSAILELVMTNLREHPEDDPLEFCTAVRDELILKYPDAIDG